MISDAISKSLETTQTYRHPQLERAISPLVQFAPELGAGLALSA